MNQYAFYIDRLRLLEDIEEGIGELRRSGRYELWMDSALSFIGEWKERYELALIEEGGYPTF